MWKSTTEYYYSFKGRLVWLPEVVCPPPPVTKEFVKLCVQSDSLVCEMVGLLSATCRSNWCWSLTVDITREMFVNFVILPEVCVNEDFVNIEGYGFRHAVLDSAGSWRFCWRGLRKYRGVFWLIKFPVSHIVDGPAYCNPPQVVFLQKELMQDSKDCNFPQALFSKKN